MKRMIKQYGLLAARCSHILLHYLYSMAIRNAEEGKPMPPPM